MSPLLFFVLAFKACLFSSGGFGNIPSLHADLLRRGFATDKTFAESVAVGQLSPGPNGLWIISLGYFVGGLAGAFASLVALSLPPLLVLLWQRLYSRVKDHPAVDGFMRGLSLAVVGIFVVVLFGLLGPVHITVETCTILAVAALLSAFTKAPVVAILGLGAAVGWLVR